MSTNFIPAVQFTGVTVSIADIVYLAARKARVLKHPGQGLSVPSESTEFMMVLNAMIDGFKAENIMIPYVARNVFNLVVGQGAYSVGPGQNWGYCADGVTPFERPEKIMGAGFIIQGSNAAGTSEIAMEVFEAFEQYQALVNKQVTSNYPLVLWYQTASPFGCATLWPIPSQTGQIALYTPQWLDEFQTYDDIVQVRAGVREMLIYNLAVRLSEEYDRPINPRLEMMAFETKKRVAANQWMPIPVRSDAGARQNAFGEGWFGGYPKAWVPYH